MRTHLPARLLATSLLSFLPLAACGSDGAASPDGAVDAGADASPDAAPPPDAPPPPVVGNNAALLDGPDVTGVLILHRKTVDIDVAAAPVDLRVGTGVVVGTGGLTHVLYPVTNAGGGDLCLGPATGELLDAAGAVVEHGEIYLEGSVRRSPQLPTYSCLAPGESGWLYQSSTTTPFDQVARTRLSVDADDTAFVEPAARVVPVSYELEGFVLRLTVRNAGTARAVLDFGHCVPLDADGAPLGYAMVASNDALEAGASVELQGAGSWGGLAVRAACRMNFRDDAP